jgi:hypothetical protein
MCLKNAAWTLLTVIGVFLLGASAGALVTHIRYRLELAELKAQLERVQQKTSERQEAA